MIPLYIYVHFFFAIFFRCLKKSKVVDKEDDLVIIMQKW